METYHYRNKFWNSIKPQVLDLKSVLSHDKRPEIRFLRFENVQHEFQFFYQEITKEKLSLMHCDTKTFVSLLVKFMQHFFTCESDMVPLCTTVDTKLVPGPSQKF